MSLTKREIEYLNVYAENRTRLHFIEGVDFDLWTYCPRDGQWRGDFTDGHCHSPEIPASVAAPDEGWVALSYVVLNADTAAAILRALDAADRLVGSVVEGRSRNVRIGAAFQLYGKLREAREQLRSVANVKPKDVP